MFLREAAGAAIRNNLLARYLWLAEHVAADILAYLDGPKSLEELQAAAAERKPGYEIHHIVEQAAARRDGFPEEWINGPDNRVRIPRFKHWEINGWYGRRNEKYGGLSPREFLREKGWDTRFEVGLEAMIEAEVLER